MISYRVGYDSWSCISSGRLSFKAAYRTFAARLISSGPAFVSTVQPTKTTTTTIATVWAGVILLSDKSSPPLKSFPPPFSVVYFLEFCCFFFFSFLVLLSIFFLFFRRSWHLLADAADRLASVHVCVCVSVINSLCVCVRVCVYVCVWIESNCQLRCSQKSVPTLFRVSRSREMCFISEIWYLFWLPLIKTFSFSFYIFMSDPFLSFFLIFLIGNLIFFLSFFFDFCLSVCFLVGMRAMRFQ